MNPFQKVPVIKDGDFVLTESVAMFRYLAREKKIADVFILRPFQEDNGGQYNVKRR